MENSLLGRPPYIMLFLISSLLWPTRECQLGETPHLNALGPIFWSLSISQLKNLSLLESPLDSQFDQGPIASSQQYEDHRGICSFEYAFSLLCQCTSELCTVVRIYLGASPALLLSICISWIVSFFLSFCPLHVLGSQSRLILKR